MGSFVSNSVDDVVMTMGTVTAVSTSVIARYWCTRLLFPWCRCKIHRSEAASAPSAIFCE